MSLDSESMLEALAKCHPALLQKLAEVREEYSPEAPAATMAMGDLGQAIVAAMRSASDADLQRMAALVEEALRTGDESTKDAVATGFLEAVMSGSSSEPDVIRLTRLFGPLAREYCREWDKFTGCRTPGVWE